MSLNNETPTLIIDASFYKDYLTPSFSILPNISTNNSDPPSSIIYTYSSTNPIVADVVDGIVTIGSVGNTTITVLQSATTNFSEVTANTIIYVSRILPTINYESSVYNKTYKDESFQLNASATNTDNDLLLYSTSDSIVANVDVFGTVTVGNAGTANITITNPQTENYYGVSANIIVNVASIQSNIIVDPSFTRTYLDSSFNLNTVTNNTETPIQYTSIDATIATIDQYGNVIVGNAGNTRIELYQPNTNNYSTVTANTIIYVNKRQATILSEPSFTQTYGNLTPFNINASKTNQETDIQYTSLNTTIATVDSYGNIIAGNIGNTIITMYQPETSNYLTVSSNTIVYINKAVPNLIIDSSFTRVYGNNDTYILNPITNNYDSPIQYTSLNPIVANVDSIGNVTFGNAGTAIILLTQAETDQFLSVTANTTIYVTRATSTLTIDASFSRNYLAPSFSIIPNITTNNSDPLSSITSYTYNSVNPSVATLSSGIVTIGNVGNTILTVTQLATTNFTEVTANTAIYVSRILPNINYTSVYNKKYKDATFQLNANTTNTDNRQLLYSTNNSIVANVDAFGNVTIGNVGTANITLVKSQTTNYYGVSANILINVTRLRSNITVNPSFTRNYLDYPFNLNANTNNTETVIEYTSLDPNIALVNQYGNITIGNAGNTRIKLYIPTTTNFSTVTAYTVIYVNKLSSSIIVAPIFYQTYGNTSLFNINALDTNPETIIQYTSLNTSVATVDSYGNIVTGNAGNASIQLYVPETTNYKTASSTAIIRVNKAQPYLTINSSFTRIYASSPFDLRPNISTSNTDTNRIIQYSTSDSDIATVVDGIVTIQGVGTATITITQLQTTNYLEVSATTLIYISKKQSIITVPSSFTTTYGNEPFSLNVTTNNDEMPLLYFSSNPSVVIVNNGLITIKGIGRSTITIAQENSSNYSPTYTTTIVYVNPKPPYIIPAGTSILNQFAYGVKSGTYTVKDKSAYPVKCTPVFSKITGQVKPCPSNSTL